MSSNTRSSETPARRGRDGFTLVEVMVAMVILTLGALGVMQLALATAVLARNTVTVTELGIRAENVLESARDRGYAGNSPGVTVDSLTVGDNVYARRLTVSDEGARARQIRVDVIRAGSSVPLYSALTYVVQ